MEINCFSNLFLKIFEYEKTIKNTTKAVFFFKKAIQFEKENLSLSQDDIDLSFYLLCK